MGLFDGIKNIFNIPDEDEYDEALEETEPVKEPKRKAAEPKAEAPRVVNGGKSKTVSFTPSQMQVVLVKPVRYDEVASIADHLNEKKTVVLNLESTDRENARRIVDFLSGVTYANHGDLKQVSKETFLLVPNGVDMMGELFIGGFEEGPNSYY